MPDVGVSPATARAFMPVYVSATARPASSEAAYAERHRDLRAVLYLSAGTEGEIEQQIAAGGAAATDRLADQPRGRRTPCVCP